MSDQKITELTEDSSPAATDLIATVEDPSGTPVTKKVTITNLSTLLATTLTGLTNTNMANRARSIWLPPSVWGVISGSPTRTVDATDNTLAWLFDAASTEIIVSEFIVLPDDFVSGNLTLKSYWAMVSATSGDVVISSQYSVTADGGTVTGIMGIDTTTTSVPGTADLLKITTHTTTLSSGYAAGNAIKFRWLRSGDAGGDTATGDLQFFGMLLSYTGDM